MPNSLLNPEKDKEDREREMITTVFLKHLLGCVIEWEKEWCLAFISDIICMQSDNVNRALLSASHIP